jgi:magnesium chelatase family protein
VPAVTSGELMGARDGESSAAVAQRVRAARAWAAERQGVANAELPTAKLDTHCALDAPARALLQRAADRLAWTGRGLHRVLKVSRTIADLAGSERISASHIAEAMQWRRALPSAA